LAALHPKARIAPDNQAVVDSSDVVFLALRPQVAEDVVTSLVFRAEQRVVTFVAGLQLEALAAWIRVPVTICRAIPVPLVADLRGVTAIYPRDPVVTDLFSSLGAVITAGNIADFELFGAACCLMGTYFGLLDVVAGWMATKGMDSERARAFLAPLFAGLAETARASPSVSFGELREAFSTKGGLNAQVHEIFVSSGGADAIVRGLETALSSLVKKR
jgi:pyrroline-5-carboxylate reductase